MLTWTQFGVPIPNIAFTTHSSKDPRRDYFTLHCAYASADFNPDHENPKFDHRAKQNWFDYVHASRQAQGNLIFLSEIIAEFNQQKHKHRLLDGVMMIFSLSCNATEWKSSSDGMVHNRTGRKLNLSKEGVITDLDGTRIDPLDLNLTLPYHSLAKKSTSSKLSREDVARVKPSTSAQVERIKPHVDKFTKSQREKDVAFLQSLQDEFGSVVGGRKRTRRKFRRKSK